MKSRFDLQLIGSVRALKRYNKGHSLYYFILNYPFQLKMASNSDYNIFSFKYIAASFVATYFSGVVHPLELIKTRFQSKAFFRQVMMANQPARILSPSTATSGMHSKSSMSMKGFEGYTRVSISHYYVRPPPCPFSFGSI